MFRLATVAALLALTPTTAAADCAMWGLAPKVMNADLGVPQDGGILVVAAALQQGALDKGDVAVQPGWRFRGAKGLVKPSIEPLAPGLAVYRLPTTGAVVLEDTKHAVVAQATGLTEPRARLATPKVASIRFESSLGRHSATTVTVTLDGAPPAGAVVLVVADGKGVPRSWGYVTSSTVTAYSSGDCHALPNGTVLSQAGDQVSVFFVDNTGRKSGASKLITIAAAPPTP